MLQKGTTSYIRHTWQEKMKAVISKSSVFMRVFQVIPT